MLRVVATGSIPVASLFTCIQAGLKLRRIEALAVANAAEICDQPIGSRIY
jgi:hypothetical protein